MQRSPPVPGPQFRLYRHSLLTRIFGETDELLRFPSIAAMCSSASSTRSMTDSVPAFRAGASSEMELEAERQS